jgi:S-adenosylmethionine/arginine decarboxylase-like enzyme
VAYTCNSSTQEVEAENLQFKAILGHITRSRERERGGDKEEKEKKKRKLANGPHCSWDSPICH